MGKPIWGKWANKYDVAQLRVQTSPWNFKWGLIRSTVSEICVLQSLDPTCGKFDNNDNNKKERIKKILIIVIIVWWQIWIYFFIFLSLCWDMFAEKVGPIFWKKELQLFSISSLLSILFPLILKYDGKYFCFVTLIEQFVYGGPSLFYVWYIFVKCWFNVNFSAVFIFLWRMQLKFLKFFSSVPCTGELKFVNLIDAFVHFVSKFDRVYNTHCDLLLPKLIFFKSNSNLFKCSSDHNPCKRYKDWYDA